MNKYKVFYVRKEYYEYEVEAPNYEAAEDYWVDECTLHMRSMLDRERYSGEPDIELDYVHLMEVGVSDTPKLQDVR